jgi:DNA-binding IclR family transcriptional regulator
VTDRRQSTDAAAKPLLQAMKTQTQTEPPKPAVELGSMMSRAFAAPSWVPAVAKAIAIIRHLNERPSAGATLPQISDGLEITRSHCHNILRTLVAHGWIEYDNLTRVYRLATGIAADSASALHSRTHLAAIRPLVDQLAVETGFPCTLCEPIADGSFLIVHTTAEADPFVLHAPVGYRFPPGTAAMFKARVAWLSGPELELMLSQWTPTPHSRSTIIDKPTMRDDLLRSRTRGYARSAGEYIEGFTTLALPLFNREGEVIFVIGIAGLEDQLDAQESRVVKTMARMTSQIHRMLDGRPPVDYPTGQ